MIVYPYPEEWTGRRAREVHTLSTCIALARIGCGIVLVTAGGESKLRVHLRELTGADGVEGLRVHALSRSWGPIRSAAIFTWHFRRWLRRQADVTAGFTIHLKAASMLKSAGLPYLFEAHEIFAETPRGNAEVQHVLEQMEHATLAEATWRVATSAALAHALRARYELPDDFAIVPNAGGASLDASVASAYGPFVYCGSIADWKGLELAVEGARLAGVPLKIVGGDEAEWRALGERCDTRGVAWQARVSLAELPGVLAGCRAGLIPTLPETGSGRYSCPMKLFDYARCGLPVVSTGLPSLESLNVGAWCAVVREPKAEAWMEAMREYRFDPMQSEAAREWSAAHTWEARARAIAQIFNKC